jgi:tetratricopeptide (TPR) repeat protein
MKFVNFSQFIVLALVLVGQVNAQSDCTDKYYQARDYYQKGLLNDAKTTLLEINSCDDPIIKLESELFLAQTYYDLQQFQRADNILLKLLKKTPGIAFKDYDLNRDFIKYCSKFYTNQRRLYFMIGESRYKYYHNRRYIDNNTGNTLANINLKETGSFKSIEMGISLAIPGTDIFVSPLIGADLTPFVFNGTFSFFNEEGLSEKYTASLEDEYFTGRIGVFIKFNDLKEKFIPNRALVNSLKGFYIGGQAFYTLQSNTKMIQDAVNAELPAELSNISSILETNTSNFNRKDLFYAASIGYNYNIPFQGKNILLKCDARYDILFNSFKTPTELGTENIDVTTTLSYPKAERVLLLHLGIGIQKLSYKPKVKRLK